MRLRIIPIVLLVLQLKAFGASQPDSLLNLLQKSKEDTTKINLLLEIAEKYNKIDPNQAIKYSQNAIQISERLKYSRGIISSQIKLGISYAKLGDMTKAMEFSSSALDNANRMGDSTFIANCYLNLGLHLHRLGDYSKSIEYIIKAINICDSIKYDKILSNCYTSLGLLYNTTGKIQKAIEYYNKAIDLLNKNNKISELPANYINLAGIYIDLNENDKALDYANKAYQINSKLGNTIGLGVDYHTMGAIYYNLNDYKKSINYFEKSLQIKESMNNKLGIALTSMALAEVYFKINQYSQSIGQLNRAEALVISTKAKPLLANIYNLYSNVYAKLNNFEKAHYYMNLHHQIQDSLSNEKSEKTIAELNAKYELTKKNRDIEILQDKAGAQNLLLLIFLLILIIIVIITIGYVLKNRTIAASNQLLTSNKKIIEKQNLELDALNCALIKTNRELEQSNATKDRFFSIIAHDLRSPISALISFSKMMVNKIESEPDSELSDISKDLYNTSNSVYNLLEELLLWAKSQTGNLSFNREIIDLKEFADASIHYHKKNADNKSIEIQTKIQHGCLVYSDWNMLMTIFRNLIDNAIKFSHPSSKVIMECSISEVNVKTEPAGELQSTSRSFVTVSISDNGIGMEKSRLDEIFKIDKHNTTLGTNNEKGSGLGLVLCKEFVERHGGNIWVESGINQGSTFYFTLPSYIENL
ncbi:MAG: Tetratricopeptide repeat protein [Ignavibacteria bacterium]|nr:Tetratricopeptide repeat protein [Ignavibacteria bacterium]